MGSRYFARRFFVVIRLFVGSVRSLIIRTLTIVRRQILNCLKLKEFADNSFRCGKNGEKFVDTIEWKTLREKEKLLVTSNFSFSLNVFHKFLWFGLRIISIKNPSSSCHKLTGFYCIDVSLFITCWKKNWQTLNWYISITIISTLCNMKWNMKII